MAIRGYLYFTWLGIKRQIDSACSNSHAQNTGLVCVVKNKRSKEERSGTQIHSRLAVTGGMRSRHPAMCACFSSRLYTLLSVYTQSWLQRKASLPHVHKHTRLIEPSSTHLVNCQSFSDSVAKLMSGTRVPEVPITLHCRNLYSSPVHFH